MIDTLKNIRITFKDGTILNIINYDGLTSAEIYSQINIQIAPPVTYTKIYNYILKTDEILFISVDY